MSAPAAAVNGFRHQALMYATEAEFLARTVPFIRNGVRASEPVLVVESSQNLHLLCSALGADADKVEFADMAEVGHNPALIIPAWQDFVDRHSGAARLRGIGEPIWASRKADELVECQRHEALLNKAFGGGRPFVLLCPYNVAELREPVIAEARRSHEFIVSRYATSRSARFRPDIPSRSPLNAAFPEPKSVVATLGFDRDGLGSLRRAVLACVAGSGLSDSQALAFVAAVNEIATNSIVHGGGRGQARIWFEPEKVICEIRDAGVINEPLADRRRPDPQPAGARGFWLANQLCDLVQIRSDATGTSVRLHKLTDHSQGASNDQLI